MQDCDILNISFATRIMNSALLEHNICNFKSTGSNSFPKMLANSNFFFKVQTENNTILRKFIKETKP